ncbi:hypothetical protein N658DRAFT_509929 [Parathielavia hyrcaniae]|uniref:C2H2-type domain-containing protein n=1 Tax=Parathielavia hyrcaniae TaxID=113614 RepID=A0AAN6SYF9_9PEZI|nr:hypothetical protein N658DRAFT_509929 [Parathielavia hyrcaniae]
MDPSTPEFRPRAVVLPTDSQPQQTPLMMSDAKWRTTCRTCGANFRSRNQLMKHLYRTHPLKPGTVKQPNATSLREQEAPNQPSKVVVRVKAPPAADKLASPTTARATTAHKPEKQSPTHPFVLLSESQKLVFVARVLFVLFNVCMRQMEEGEEEEQARQQVEDCRLENHQDLERNNGDRDRQHSRDNSRVSSPKSGLSQWEDAGSAITLVPVAEAQLTSSQPAADQHGHHSRAAAPGVVHRGRVKDGEDSEDSDDEDGGVALSKMEE